MSTEEKVLAWHFSAADKKLGYGDGRVIKRGSTLKVKGDLKLCNYGLHASVRLIDALANAPGPYLWRVEVGGTIIHGDDKLVGTERKALWGFDATPMLKAFARQCALDVVHLWDCPDVVRKFLQTGDESLRAAARAAARDAAMAAAWDAAMAAAWAAARDAAWDAAMAAAWAAARAAAWDAARDDQNERLTSLAMKYAK